MKEYLNWAVFLATSLLSATLENETTVPGRKYGHPGRLDGRSQWRIGL
jgi:hypothetical protein